MSSGEPKIIYQSEHRTVVSGHGLVLHLSGDTGWVRKPGTGGPMHGELVSIFAGGAWSPELDAQASELLVALSPES